MAGALNRLMGLGVGLAVAGAVVKSTLYNGMTVTFYCEHLYSFDSAYEEAFVFMFTVVIADREN